MNQSLDLADLAESAAQIVVKGVAGTVAEALRSRLVRLFTRNAPERAAQSPEVRRLDETDDRLAQAEDRAAEERALMVSWKRRLEVFLEDHPDAVEELAQIVEQYRPPQAEDFYPRGSQIATAGDGAVVIQAGRDNSGGVTR